jgi:hypothetical protein
MTGEVAAVEQEQRRCEAEAAATLASAIANGRDRGNEGRSYPTAAIEDARRRRDEAGGAVEIIETQLRQAEGARTRTQQDIEKAATLVAADQWLMLSDAIEEREAALAELVARRRDTSVWLSSNGRITRSSGGLLARLIGDPEAG